MVSGAPGSGKSTLARRVAEELDLPLFSKDAVKEALMDALSVPDLAASRRLGRAALEVVSALAASSEPGAVLEANFRRSLSLERLDGLPGPVVELCCRCAPKLARRRYLARSALRHPGHLDATRPLEELFAGEGAGPVSGGWPVPEVRTDDEADWGEAVAFLAASMRAD